MPGAAALGAGADPEESYDFLFKLVLIGDASVGKTCLVQRFKTGAFSERQGSTIGVDFTMKSLEIQGKRVKVRERAGVSSAPLAGQEQLPAQTGPVPPGAPVPSPLSLPCPLSPGCLLAPGCLQGRGKLSWALVFPERDVQLAD
ncbi:hypothetical protein IHE44_0003357 [Lamprotornis superbus]|uniref:RAB43 protein n=1 Tax=Lamprotornis superbus TaxID=245042 RepID=A0A835TNH9_9PASS|nr:hypothetical protein IHE44_0003357 [Lamprotornis superbus]